MSLVILAQITAVAGQEELVKTALQKLVAPTLLEEGCLQYDLHQDNDNSGFFMFYEIWENRELWQAHLKSPHIVTNGEITKGAIADIKINEMSLI